MFASIYKDKSVLVTGHTGFKGAWLSFWLNKLGARVTGISKDVPTEPSLFNSLKLSHFINDLRGDIVNSGFVAESISSVEPDFVFHLAAQPIVKKSYDDPVGTFETNVLGTINVLNALIKSPKPCAAVMITSDKCYENQEWTWGYRENDRLGGKDPYSASKAAAEIAISAMHHSFFKSASSVSIASARAGNVIGGGDWAPNRIVPDAMRSWAEKNPVKIRNPHSTRPWQHVLEPLSGYLLLGQRLREKGGQKFNGESFNFGPSASQNLAVLGLLEKLALVWRAQVLPEFVQFEPQDSFHESGLLKLNCDKAQHLLDWFPTLDIDQTIEFTGEWYVQFHKAASMNMIDYTNMQINKFQQHAIRRGCPWAE